MKHTVRKIGAFILALCLVVSILVGYQSPAYAGETQQQNTYQIGFNAEENATQVQEGDEISVTIVLEGNPGESLPKSIQAEFDVKNAEIPSDAFAFADGIKNGRSSAEEGTVKISAYNIRELSFDQEGSFALGTLKMTAAESDQDVEISGKEGSGVADDGSVGDVEVTFAEKLSIHVAEKGYTLKPSSQFNSQNSYYEKICHITWSVSVDGVERVSGLRPDPAEVVKNIPAGAAVTVDFVCDKGYGFDYTDQFISEWFPDYWNNFFKNANTLVRMAVSDASYQPYQLHTCFTMPKNDVEFYAVKDCMEVVPTKKIAITDDLENGTLSLEEGKDETVFKETFSITATPEFGYRLSKASYSIDGGETWTSATNIDSNRITIKTPDEYNKNWSEDGTILIRADFEETQDLQITSEDELRQFAKRVNSGDTFDGMTVSLMNDIALSQDMIPIGYLTSIFDTSKQFPFRGTFEGNGHTISGLHMTYDSIKASEYEDSLTAALFGCVADAEIKDLTVEGSIEFAPDRQRDGWACAGIAAYATDTTISGCVSIVDINAGTIFQDGISESCYAVSVGGIAVEFSGTIANCMNYGNLEAVSSLNLPTGGIVSELLDGSIRQSGNYGYVHTTPLYVEGSNIAGVSEYFIYSCSGYVGGITGHLYEPGSITSSFNKGEIVAAGEYQGGIAGQSEGTITDCYNIADVTGNSSDKKKGTYPRVGGLIGWHGQAQSGHTFVPALENAYSTGKVSFSRGATAFAIGNLVAFLPSLPVVAGKSTNVYDVNSSFDAAALNNGRGSEDAAWKADETGINGGYPLLIWEEDSASEETHKVTFNISEADAEIRVFSGDAEQSGSGKVFDLKAGSYTYIATKAGYISESGSFTVSRRDLEIAIEMSASAEVTFETSPADAELILTYNNNEVKPDTAGGSTYTLYAGKTYSYNAYKDGYSSVGHEFVAKDGDVIKVTLVSSDYSEDNLIYGDLNTGKTSKITSGGRYSIAPEATGVITVSTSDPVTLVGRGVAADRYYKDLYIKYTVSRADLTLDNVYLSDSTETSHNMIDFTGTGNTLNFSGVSILDFDQNASGYAMIHVADDTELTVTGGTVYMYKRQQGAGIGGNGGANAGEGKDPETNGKITIRDAVIYGKNSKQGALIGAGAQAGTQKPGDIVIENSTLYLIAVSRGAAIGGSAGTGGASSGANVNISDSQITINIDYSGAAIGGGGSDNGNDANGGMLYYTSGSIRTYLDYNAIDPSGNGLEASGDSRWKGITEPGVNNNAGITANIVNADGENMALLTIDTDTLNPSTSSFTVKDNGSVIYKGGLHQYGYVNEALQKESQRTINYTMDNWVPISDPNLYVYLPVDGLDHTVNINGTDYGTEYKDGVYRLTEPKNAGETPHTHTIVALAAKEPTCTEPGNIACYTCTECGKYFADSKGSRELAASAVLIPAKGHKLTKTEAKEAAAGKPGNIAYWTCSVCGKIYSDAEGKTEIGLADTVITADAKDEASQELEKSVSNIETVFAEIVEAIQAADTGTGLSEDAAQVTDAEKESYQVLQLVIKEAQTLIQSGQASDSQMKEAIAKVEAAAVDTASVSLEQELIRAETILENGDSYTKETSKALQEAMNQANILLSDQQATLEQIIAAKKAVATAKAALVKAPAGKDDDGKSTDDGKGGTAGKDIDAITPSNAAADAAKVVSSLKQIKSSSIKTTASQKKKTMTIRFPKVKGAVNYRISYRKAGSKTWKKAWTKGKTTYTLKKLKKNGCYQFKVAAYAKKNGKWVKGKDSVVNYRYFAAVKGYKLKAGKKQIKVSWKKYKGATGYRITYSTNKNMKNAKVINVGKSKTSAVIKKLKKGKKYYVRIRPLKKKSGKTYIGILSKKKVVKVK